MSPLRFIILAVLVYILYRLLVGGKKSRLGKAGDKGKGTAMQPPAQDVLVEDPVCHTYIPKRQAVLLQQQNKTYFFCSKRCRETFLSNKGAKP